MKTTPSVCPAASFRLQRVRPATQSAGFTLIELLAVIAIIGVLGSLAFFGFNKARLKAKDTQCLDNLRTLGQGFGLYLIDNKGTYFGAGPGSSAVGPTAADRGWYRWPARLGPYLNLTGPQSIRVTAEGLSVPILDNGYRHSVMHCPFTDPDHWTDKNVNPTMGIYGANPQIISDSTTGLNMTGIRHNAINNPSRTVLMGDLYSGDTYTGSTARTAGVLLDTSGPYPAKFSGLSANNGGEIGKGTCNILFADGHVSSIDLSTLNPWPTSSGNGSALTFTP